MQPLQPSRLHGKQHTLTAAALALLLTACGQAPAPEAAAVARESDQRAESPTTDLQLWPELAIPGRNNPELEQRIEKLLAGMTLEQKVAQMIQPEIRDITVEDMRQYGFGSYLNGGGSFPDGNKHATPQEWIDLAEAMYQASMDDSLDGIAIPTMWGTDAVHGHNNVIGATLFPHNIGLGAARNAELIEAIAAATAREVMATGIDWVFAPTVAVAQDDRWGRTYESYSEDPALVRDYSRAIVEGLQGAADKDFLSDRRVIATVKHFLGDGGTEGGDDQGDTLASEQELFEIHGQGYVGGLTAGAQTVMASFNSWNGVKNHGNPYLLTDVLKTRMGFDGLVVGDWNGHGQIPGCSNQSCPQAVNAGLDIFMVPTDAWKPLYHNTIAQVKSGAIPQERIDDAVRRILRVKFRAGLFDKPSPAKRPLSGQRELIGHPEHRALARQAVRESLVLLKNQGSLLPLEPGMTVMVTGDGADNIGKQSGGWSITWQGTGNQNGDFPGATSIYAGLADAMSAAGGQAVLTTNGDWPGTKAPDAAIVVFGEEPYAEGNGDLDNLEYQRGNKRDLALLQRLKAQGIPVVSVFITGRALWVNPEINASDAFVVAWLPGTEGNGLADVLLKAPDGSTPYGFTGTLPFSWPATPQQARSNLQDKDANPLLPVGYGLKYGETGPMAARLSEDDGMASSTVPSRVLLNQGVKAPWQMVMGASIGDEQQSEPVSSSAQSNAVLSLHTADRIVQEDTLVLDFNGSGEGWLRLQGNFPEDLRALLDGRSALSIELQVSAPLTDKLFVGMDCEGDCQGEVELHEAINRLGGKWGTVTIDLQCFAQQGVNFAKILSPFVLSADATTQLKLGEVALLPGAGPDAHYRCPL
ncbi:glycoside hydrolase family 3 protein [Ferrimonas balearica]|uniref:glycoside hydrolase family 3 protein n=1 Tax=Ferrimonas balearica TaxID=44012 RepID=UPI001C98F808|nr:glycoside hydrolase family 3 N-terminal domain-containing protein [Ferrimonas balearica]MBY5922336.1 glycoside hydrolase family 3 C-terminal domain-containing protein [Ferrimonas balearica]MBY5994324.1 glycoside hydrolase family 3 C-terminal domain-containing protein [Ferrimonas balearica]